MENKILGTWEGNYRYLRDNVDNKVGKFIMEIAEINVNNQFIGTVIDVTENRTSTIKGEFKDPVIQFVKTYDHTELVIENKKVSLDIKHHITYEGELSDENHFYGTWFRREQLINYQGTEYIIQVQRGSWSAGLTSK